MEHWNTGLPRNNEAVKLTWNLTSLKKLVYSFRESGISENRQYKICKVVSEVSSFVANPVYNNYFCNIQILYKRYLKIIVQWLNNSIWRKVFYKEKITSPTCFNVSLNYSDRFLYIYIYSLYEDCIVNN